MPHDLKENKAITTKLTAAKILAQVPYANGFHFFTSIGQYTGETAISLEHFAGEMAHIPIESIEFHFKRGDFQKWIVNTLGDNELASEIGHIDGKLDGETLRKRLLTVLNKRINNLKTQIT